MALWAWLADSAGLLLVLALLYGLALVVRRKALARHGGTFELSLRVRDLARGRGWVLGLGRYSGDRLEWFRIFSLWPRPGQSWARGDLTYDSQRDPEGGERLTLYAGHLVVVCGSCQGPVQLAMSPSALTGLQSWLEAGPPGAASHRER